MTRRRQTYRKKSGNYSHSNAEPATTETPLTFGMAWQRLIKGLKHTFLPSKYLGRKCFIKGKSYKITGETVDNFFINEFPKRAFSKVGNQYKIK